MKNLLLGATAIVPFFVMPAVAADMPLKAAATAAPVASWTGFYVGANLGGASQQADTTLAGSGEPFSKALFDPTFALGGIPSASVQDSRGVIGGITLGYNFQFSPLVFGIEGDAMGTKLSGTTTSSTSLPTFPTLTTTTTTETDWLATFRGRVGWQVAPATLFYATGGGAFGGVKGSTSITPSGGSTCSNNAFCSVGSVSDTRTGWVAGAGAEQKFGAWSVKLEYLHYDLGTFSYTSNEASPAFAAIAGTPNVLVRTRVNGDIVRGGLNFHF